MLTGRRLCEWKWNDLAPVLERPDNQRGGCRVGRCPPPLPRPRRRPRTLTANLSPKIRLLPARSRARKDNSIVCFRDEICRRCSLAHGIVGLQWRRGARRWLHLPNADDIHDSDGFIPPGLCSTMCPRVRTVVVGIYEYFAGDGGAARTSYVRTITARARGRR